MSLFKISLKNLLKAYHSRFGTLSIASPCNTCKVTDTKFSKYSIGKHKIPWWKSLFLCTCIYLVITLYLIIKCGYDPKEIWTVSRDKKKKPTSTETNIYNSESQKLSFKTVETFW